MAIYIDTIAFAEADWQAAYADIMQRYTPGDHRDAVIEDARDAYGERKSRAFDATHLAKAFPTNAGKNIYDTDAKTYSFADPANGYQTSYSAFPVYYDAGALIVQELDEDNRLRPVRRTTPTV